MNLKKIETSHEKFGALCICAVRYCLGRRTYMVNLVTNYLSAYLKEMSKQTLDCFKRDIEEYIDRGYDLGDNCDKEDWNSFLSNVRKEIVNRRGDK